MFEESVISAKYFSVRRNEEGIVILVNRPHASHKWSREAANINIWDNECSFFASFFRTNTPSAGSNSCIRPKLKQGSGTTIWIPFFIPESTGHILRSRPCFPFFHTLIYLILSITSTAIRSLSDCKLTNPDSSVFASPTEYG